MSPTYLYLGTYLTYLHVGARCYMGFSLIYPSCFNVMHVSSFMEFFRFPFAGLACLVKSWSTGLNG